MKVMCYHCHLNWWHKNPMEAAEWFANKFPDRWEYLQANRGMQKFSISELEELKKYYKELVDESTRRRSVFSEPDMGVQVLDMFDDIRPAEDMPQ